MPEVMNMEIPLIDICSWNPEIFEALDTSVSIDGFADYGQISTYEYRSKINRPQINTCFVSCREIFRFDDCNF